MPTPEEMLRDLLAGMKDKQAASTWGKVADEKAKADSERPMFWKRAEGAISGTVTSVYEDDDFEKVKKIPHIELTGDDGRKWKWAISTVGFARIGMAKQIQKGDHIELVLGKKEPGKKYYVGDDIIVTRDGKEVKAVGAADSDEVPF